MKKEFRLYAGKTVIFDLLRKEMRDNPTRFTKVGDIDGIPFYRKGKKLLIDTKDFYFVFESLDLLTLFIKKVLFFYVKEIDESIFFELVEEDELAGILREHNMEKDGSLSVEGNSDVYVLSNGQILSTDIHHKGGELYESINDYLMIRTTF